MSREPSSGPALVAPEAEIAVLGACFLAPAAAQTVCATLRETDFFEDRHQRILRAIRTICSRGDTPDLALVVTELAGGAALESAGGAAYLHTIFEAVPTSANLPRYLRMVQEAAGRRRLRQACLATVEQLGDPASSLPEIAAQLTEDIDSAGATESDRRRTLPVKIDAALKSWLLHWDDGPATLIGMGFPALDTALGGGSEPGEFCILGARQGVGKTALALSIAVRRAQQGHGVLVVSREMRLKKLLNRMLAQTGRIRASGLRSGRLTPTEYHQMRQAYDTLHPLPLWLDDQTKTVEQITGAVERWPYTPPLSLVVVDYLQLVRAPRGIQDRRLQVEHVSGALKDLAHSTGVTVLCLSAMSRTEKGNTDRRPVVQDLRESGAIEHDADIILLLHRGFAEAETEVIVAKNRDGAVGIVPLTFEAEFVSFTDAGQDNG